MIAISILEKFLYVWALKIWKVKEQCFHQTNTFSLCYKNECLCKTHRLVDILKPVAHIHIYAYTYVNIIFYNFFNTNFNLFTFYLIFIFLFILILCTFVKRKYFLFVAMLGLERSAPSKRKRVKNKLVAFSN